MGLMHSISEIPEKERAWLLEMARRSIAKGLVHAQIKEVSEIPNSEVLHHKRATFVSLHRNERLRGCIGVLEPIRTLIEDVRINAFLAAFEDPRFPRLSIEELEDVDIEISVLSQPVAIEFTTEEELIQQIVPHHDGLLLEAQGHHGTFLPVVWQSLPDPSDFWTQLKLKAGLPVTYFSPEMRVSKYTTESFSDRSKS